MFISSSDQTSSWLYDQLFLHSTILLVLISGGIDIKIFDSYRRRSSRFIDRFLYYYSVFSIQMDWVIQLLVGNTHPSEDPSSHNILETGSKKYNV